MAIVQEVAPRASRPALNPTRTFSFPFSTPAPEGRTPTRRTVLLRGRHSGAVQAVDQAMETTPEDNSSVRRVGPGHETASRNRRPYWSSLLYAPDFQGQGRPSNAPHFYSRSFLRTSVHGQVRKMRKDSHRGPGVDHLLGFCHSWITRAPVGIRILNARVRSGLRSLRSMPCANAVILADFMPSVAMGPRRTALAICVELKLRPAPVSISRAPRVPRQ